MFGPGHLHTQINLYSVQNILTKIALILIIMNARVAPKQLILWPEKLKNKSPDP